MINILDGMKADIKNGEKAGTMEIKFTFKDIERTMIVDYHDLINDFLDKESPRFAMESGMLWEIYEKYGRSNKPMRG